MVLPEKIGNTVYEPGYLERAPGVMPMGRLSIMKLQPEESETRSCVIILSNRFLFYIKNRKER